MFEVVLDDGTGPMTVVAWNDKGEELAECVEEYDLMSEEGQSEVWWEVCIFQVRAMKNSLPKVCSINTIVTVDQWKSGRSTTGAQDDGDGVNCVDMWAGTSFRWVLASEARERVQSIGDNDSLREHFVSLEKMADHCPPFRCNLHGNVADMQDAVTISTGKLMRMFTLVDGKGRYVVIRQLGCGAVKETIKNDMPVKLYYIVVRNARRTGEDGNALAYESSVFVPSNVKTHLCKPTQQICIPSGL